MAQTWITVRVEEEFAEDLSLLAKAEGFADRSKWLRYILQNHRNARLAHVLQEHVNRLQKEGDDNGG